jgi:tetratricopeptide (TPR) repeat protein
MKPRFTLFARIIFALILSASLTALADGDQSASSLVAKGYDEWTLGHLDKAQQLFELALKAEPKSIEARMKLAGLFLSRNQFDKSIKAYKQIIGMDPKNAKAWMGIGIAYLHTGNKDMTRAAWNEAIKVDPSREKELRPLLARLDSSPY